MFALYVEARARTLVWDSICYHVFMSRIGITTTIPVEAVYAAGHVPVDLNNSFISSPDRQGLVEEAETVGFPANFCAWVKGIYGLLKTGRETVDAVVAVTQGDCSNAQALAESWQADGIEVIPFAYPYDKDPEQMALQVRRLAERLGAEPAAVERSFAELDEVRSKIWELDRLTWSDGRVSAAENHLFQVCCSDFEGDPQAFARKAEALLEEAKRRPPKTAQPKDPGIVRLGYIGVPPIAPEIYDFVESLGARVVFNEVQRQFTLPGGAPDLVGRYLQYTYPYSVFGRMEDIKRETKARGLHGIIHYVQSFCFRQVEDMIMRRYLQVPMLAVEMDQAVRLDQRTKTRLETFVQLLRGGEHCTL